MAKPTPLQQLTHGKWLTEKNFPTFVDTFNYVTQRCDNIKGDYDTNPSIGHVKVDNSDPDHPIIRLQNLSSLTNSQLSGIFAYGSDQTSALMSQSVAFCPDNSSISSSVVGDGHGNISVLLSANLSGGNITVNGTDGTSAVVSSNLYIGSEVDQSFNSPHITTSVATGENGDVSVLITPKIFVYGNVDGSTSAVACSKAIYFTSYADSNLQFHAMGNGDGDVTIIAGAYYL